VEFLCRLGEVQGDDAAKGYWTNPNGVTPAATLYLAVLSEIAAKAKDARCLLHEPLARRRELLAEIVEHLHVPEVIFSAGVVGTGTTLYAAAVAQGYEGAMAKHLASTYRPGRRSTAWRKIKPKQRASRE
jgi:hypothetical protein